MLFVCIKIQIQSIVELINYFKKLMKIKTRKVKVSAVSYHVCQTVPAKVSERQQRVKVKVGLTLLSG